MPVQVSAVAHRHTGGLCQQFDDQRRFLDHKVVQLNAVVAAGLDVLERLQGVVVVVAQGADHDLLHRALGPCMGLCRGGDRIFMGA